MSVSESEVGLVADRLLEKHRNDWTGAWLEAALTYFASKEKSDAEGMALWRVVTRTIADRQGPEWGKHSIFADAIPKEE